MSNTVLGSILDDTKANTHADGGWWYYIVFKTTYMAVCAIVGTISNIFIIGAVVIEKKLKYLGSAFVVNLALADMLVTAILFPVTAMNIWEGKQAVSDEFCIYVGMLTVISCMTSMLNLAAIAIDRYILICHSALHRRYFGRILVAGILVFTWLASFLTTVPALFFYNDLGYLPFNDMCTIRFMNAPSWYTHFVIQVGVSSPMVLCFFCYFQIFLTIKKSKNRIASKVTNVATNQSDREKKAKKAEVSLFKTLALVFFLFVLFWTPFNVVISLTDYLIPVPKEVYAWAAAIALTNSIVNGFIYGLSNKLFRDGYRKIVQLLLCNTKWKWLQDNSRLTDVSTVHE